MNNKRWALDYVARTHGNISSEDAVTEATFIEAYLAGVLSADIAAAEDEAEIKASGPASVYLRSVFRPNYRQSLIRRILNAIRATGAAL